MIKGWSKTKNKQHDTWICNKSKTNLLLQIQKWQFGMYGTGWVVVKYYGYSKHKDELLHKDKIFGWGAGQRTTPKRGSTKAEAKKFALAWMKKHPRG